MRLTYNRDEVPAVRKILHEELSSGATEITIHFSFDRAQAEHLLAKIEGNDNELVIVFAGAGIGRGP
jgi:hypothetical protein